MVIKEFCLNYIHQLSDFEKVQIIDNSTASIFNMTGNEMADYRKWQLPKTELLTRSISDLDIDGERKTVTIIV